MKNSRTEISRRRFLSRAAVAGATLSLVPRHVLGGPRFVPPSEKVNIAIVGCGGQGRTNLRGLFPLGDAQVIAVADPIESMDFWRLSTFEGLPDGYP
jgi:hypothetical protein